MTDAFYADTDALHWQLAGAFVVAYGDAWPDEAMACLKEVAADDPPEFERWTDLIDKMVAIAETPRQ